MTELTLSIQQLGTIKRNANEDPIVYELPNPLQNAVDKEILKKISNLTEGRFYEGKNKSELLFHI